MEERLNTSLVRSKLDLIDRRINSLRYKLEVATKSNARQQKLSILQRDTAQLVNELSSVLRDNKQLGVLIGTEEVAYKERRLGFIDGKITERLKDIFPTRDLVAHTDCDFKRFQTKLRLYLKDVWGNKRPPFITEGKGAQQLISYTAAESSLSLLGNNKIYLDEAFSNASEVTQSKIQLILGKSISDGFQIILISHSPLIYQDLPRREFHFESDSQGFVKHISQVDYLEISDV